MMISSNYFIFINIFILLIYLAFIFIGYKKGFLYELVSFAYTAVSALIAWFLAPVFAGLYPIAKIEDINKEIEIVSKFVDLNAIVNTIFYFVIIFLVLKLFYILLTFVLKGFNKIPVIGKFNQILGIFAGIFNATLITLALGMLLNLPIFKNGNEIKNGTIFRYISNYSENILTYVVDNVDLDHLKQQFDSFNVDNAREEFKAWIVLNKTNE